MNHWLASSISVRGTSHVASDEECQDYCIARRYGEAQILALSDGAGSCEYSQIGARAACIGFIRASKKMLNSQLLEGGSLDEFLENSTEDQWHLAIEGARKCIEIQATKKNVNSNVAMACTFLGAIVGRYAGVVLQVGDGAWVAEVESSIIGCVTVPKNGEYGNETFFITQSGWMDHIQFVRFQKSHGLRSLVGFSDGVERLCIDFPASVPNEGFFRPLFKIRRSAERQIFQNALGDFLRSERVTQQTEDDCSIVGVCRDSF